MNNMASCSPQPLQSPDSVAGRTVSLPLAFQPNPAIRTSKNGPRRAAVLIAVHVFIIIHVVHYLIQGKTLSPVEPSESMYTLELGQLNAGFILFGLALVATVIFGRFFCGWGCHVVAYQDLCGWIMKKLGVQPQPVRSRLLLFVPLGLALYMFVWPSLKRVLFSWDAFSDWVATSPIWLGFVFGSPPPDFPGLSNHIMTTGFWMTFPGPVFAVLTILVCGFLAVYVLGAKGFCTYACPYGGFFAPLDKLSPARIRVTDDCEQCGHCTAVCTSNVSVSEEVNRYGMVMDPGCMKCMDCVSVCPKNALYYGVGKPAVAVRSHARNERSHSGRERHAIYQFSISQEFALFTIFLVTTLSLRGLYDGPPLLLSVALGGVTAALALKCGSMVRQPTVLLQNMHLKLAGTIQRPGLVLSILSLAWGGFVAHSGFVQWHRTWGNHHLSLTEAGMEIVTAPREAWPAYSAGHYRALSRGERHLRLADRWGLVDVMDVKKGLAWVSLCRGDDTVGVGYIREAIAAAPTMHVLREQLVAVLTARGNIEESIEAMNALFLARPARADERFRLANLYVSRGRMAEAMAEYEACLEMAPESFEAHYNYGGLLGREGRYEAAIEHLQTAQSLNPDDVDVYLELSIACIGAGRVAEGFSWLEAAQKIAPNDPRPSHQLKALIDAGYVPPR